MIDKLLRRIPLGLLENPWEVPIAAAGVGTGVFWLFGGEATRIDENLPHLVFIMWAACITVGCLFTMVGAYRCKVACELFGLWLLAGSSGSYGLVLLVFYWPEGALTGATRIAISLSCLIQIMLSSRGYRMRPPLTEEGI